MCCQSAHDDGLAVRSLFCNVVHADVAAGAGFVFNNDVAQVMTSFFSDGTGCDVQRASGRIRNNIRIGSSAAKGGNAAQPNAAAPRAQTERLVNLIVSFLPFSICGYRVELTTFLAFYEKIGAKTES